MTLATRLAPAARWSRPVAVGLALVVGGMAVYQLVALAIARPMLLAADVVSGYLPGAQRFLDVGTPYTPEQLAGPWALGYHSFIHPPAALPLFIPFLALPVILWWAVPLALTGYAVWRLRPAPWAWPIMAACLLWPRSAGSILAGNTDMWAMAFVAAGAVWGWPAVLLAVKPTFAPLALLAIRRRSAWLAAPVGLAFMALTLPLWLDWWTVTRNAGLPLAYSLLNLPLVLVPVIAWAGRR